MGDEGRESGRVIDDRDLSRGVGWEVGFMIGEGG